MNDTITLPRLAELVAAHASCQYADAEKFVKAFFAHLEDALAVSDEVTIDGLGIFSRTPDSENPIVFSPTKSIAEALNQPFEMFEPIAVGDADLTSNDEITAPEIDTPAPVTPPPPPITEERIENLNQANENEELKTPTPPPAPLPTQSSTPEPEAIASPIYYEPERPRIAPWIILAFILGLLFGAVIAYFSYDRINAIFRADTDKHEQIDEPTITEPQSDAHTPIIEVIENDSISTPTDSIMPAEQNVEVKPSPVYDTVTPERFLTTMARQYYGQMEYWVFIYEANSETLGNPNRIKPGTRVIIPDKTEFTEGESPDQTLARAKRKGREIYERFQ